MSAVILYMAMHIIIADLYAPGCTAPMTAEVPTTTSAATTHAPTTTAIFPTTESNDGKGGIIMLHYNSEC